MSLRKNGYTLIEMMMVVGIVGVTATSALPTFMKRAPQRRSEQASWQIFLDLQRAKARAVSENLAVEISIDNGIGSYTIWVDSNGDGLRNAGESETKDLAGFPGTDLYAYPSTMSFNPSGTMTTSYSYFYMRVYVAEVGFKYVYVFPNGHIDPMRIQSS